MRKTLLTVLLAAVLLMVAACGGGEAPADTDPTPAPAPAAPSEPAEPVEAEPAEPEPVQGVEAAPQAELLADLSCGGKGISFTLTNIGETSWTLSEQEYLINSVPDNSPECDADVLEVGQATTCSLDQLALERRFNAISFESNDGERANARVKCEAGSLDETDEIADGLPLDVVDTQSEETDGAVEVPQAEETSEESAEESEAEESTEEATA